MSERLLLISKILIGAGNAIKKLEIVPKERRKQHLHKLSILLMKIAKELDK